MNEEKHNINYKINIAVDRAINDKKSNGFVRLGKPKLGEILFIKLFYQIDVTEWNKILLDNDIRHMLNEHGKEHIEKLKCQISITIIDIKNIQNIINNYDEIIKGNSNREGNSIIYKKIYDNNTIYLTEIIICNKKLLKIKTMWKKQSIVANSKTPSTTSITDNSSSISSLSDKNIS